MLTLALLLSVCSPKSEHALARCKAILEVNILCRQAIASKILSSRLAGTTQGTLVRPLIAKGMSTEEVRRILGHPSGCSGGGQIDEGYVYLEYYEIDTFVFCVHNRGVVRCYSPGCGGVRWLMRRQ